MKDQKKYSQNILARKIKEFTSQGRNRFYLRDIVEETQVPLTDAEDFFVPLLQERGVEGSLEVRCSKCGVELGTYKNYPAVPNKLECELCGTKTEKSTDFLEIVLEVKGKFFRTQKKAPLYYSKKAYKTGIK